MAESKQDLRTIRTERAIRTAFEQLLMTGQRPIKVTELAKAAGINRKTFYSHYDTIEDFVQVYIQDIQDDLIQRLQAHRIDDYLAQDGLLISVFVDFFESNRQFYTNILMQSQYLPIVQRASDQVLQQLADRFAAAMDMPSDDALLLVTYTCSTMLAMLRLRASGQVHLSTHAIREKTEKLTATGLKGALNLKR